MPVVAEDTFYVSDGQTLYALTAKQVFQGISPSVTFAMTWLWG